MKKKSDLHEFIWFFRVEGWTLRQIIFFHNFICQKVSKNVAAACVGAKNLHTGRPWLQKTGKEIVLIVNCIRHGKSLK